MSKSKGSVPLTHGLSLRDAANSAGDLADRYRRVLNRATATAIVTLDVSGLVTGWSEGATALLGWSEEEMLGQSLGRIFPEEVGGASAFLAEIAEAAVKGTAGAEGWRARKDGQRVWGIGETSLLYEQDPSGGFVKVLRDRTEHRQTELALMEQTRALELLNRASAALARESDLEKLVQAVTDVGVALCGAEFGAFFYNVINQDGKSYTLYTLSGVPREAFSKFPMPRNTSVSRRPSWGRASSGLMTSRSTLVTAKMRLNAGCRKGICRCGATWQSRSSPGPARCWGASSSAIPDQVCSPLGLSRISRAWPARPPSRSTTSGFLRPCSAKSRSAAARRQPCGS